ncbi:Methionyl-tRNA formyltransferase, partial [Streptococcus agalactiae H36B]
AKTKNSLTVATGDGAIELKSQFNQQGKNLGYGDL